MNKDKFYITTSIAYANASPHIGFALELLQADVLARHKRQQGADTRFLTGTDEHGLKIQRKAKEENQTPEEFVDGVVEQFQDLTKKLNISTDDFIRTTDQDRHWPAVKALWKKLEENDDLYKEVYEGYYCVGCEAFMTEKDLEDGLCPIHEEEPQNLEEENYFFKLSEYEDQIKEVLKNDKVNIVPEGRKKEILNFVEDGLEDVSVSRSAEKLKWGIPVPGEESQKMYVWVDALTNYISSLGYPEETKDLETFWPADVHCVGKDILRFHSVIWIGLLLSAGLELPENIFVHGFITRDGKKMSKSLGNVVDPFDLVDRFGVDSVRYYFLRQIPPTGDGDYTEKKFKSRHNADLADGLGNLLARTISLAQKEDVEFDEERKPGREVGKKVQETEERVDELLEEFELKKALNEIWDLIHFMDSYIEKHSPWEESWDQEKVIFEMLYVCYHLHKLLIPFLPSTADQIKNQVENLERENLFEKL